MKNYLVLLFFIMTLEAYSQKMILYAGTFSTRESKGIYVYEFDSDKGTLNFIQAIADRESPTFVVVHPSGKYLYAVNRMPLEGDKETGSVTAYTIDQKTGKLQFLNHVSSYGKRPCYLSVDKSGAYVFVSNYDEGNVVMLSIEKNGSLGAVTDIKKYGVQNKEAEEQRLSHIHTAIPSPDNKFLYVLDLGLDKIFVYSLDVKNGKLMPAQPSEILTAKGTGPRHFTFHPKYAFAYVAEELTSSVASFSVDAASGRLTLMQDMVPSLPEGYTGKNSSADIRIDTQGKFLYLSNRGHDSLAVYSIDADGKLKLTGLQASGGKTPRYLVFDATGKYMLVANENSDAITVFEQNSDAGMLTVTGHEVKIPSPVCLQFLTLK